MIQYLTSILTEGAIFGIMALGLNVIWGWSGDFDLAYYGYVALGAYMTLVFTIGHPLPPAQYIVGLQLPYLVAIVLAVLGLVLGARSGGASSRASRGRRGHTARAPALPGARAQVAARAVRIAGVMGRIAPLR
jgi:ABC-type branched-subunit amino acid transport system permease subunit